MIQTQATKFASEMDGGGRFQGKQRLATSLPQTLRSQARHSSRESWRRGKKEVGLELPAAEEDLANFEIEEDVSSEVEDGDACRPESCITSSVTETEVHCRLEEVRS